MLWSLVWTIFKPIFGEEIVVVLKINEKIGLLGDKSCDSELQHQRCKNLQRHE
jgi:hypothetical protein